MNKTATRFADCLQAKMFPMHIIKVKEDGNDTVFAFGQKIKDNEVTIIIDFDEDSKCVDLTILDLVKLSGNCDKKKVYEKLNEINSSYRFPKFHVNEENSIISQITIPYESEVSGEMVFDMLRSMMTFCHNVVDDLNKYR
ncbi:YbjN domain-containing protein [Haloimpatiens sp. FM7330]|uniref:YbjN domain-containing protein n=1 Tax=Haloimpatiens sp. FM7330 TaxID=3298610 RepID=UPI00362567AE